MLTRSQARKRIKETKSKMSNESDKEMSGSAESSEEINNQLGDPEVMAQEEEYIRQEMSKDRAEGQQEPQSVLQMILERLGQVQEDMKDIKASQRKGQEDMKEIREDLSKKINSQSKSQEEMRAELTKLIREEVKEIKVSQIKLREEVKREIQQSHETLKEEMRRNNECWQEEIKKTEQKWNRVIQQQEEKGKIEINKTTKNLSDNLNRINQEVRKEIKSTREVIRAEVTTISTENKEENRQIIKQQEEMEEQLRRIAEEKGRRIDEVQESQERLKQKVTELETRPVVSNVMNAVNQEVLKEVRYNGRDEYPMEFLKDLREIQRTYYPDGSVKWLNRHLTEGAMVWWRIIQAQIHTYEQFEEAFILKFWSQQIQEGIRDNLEFGRFNPNGRLSMIQYVENKILQCRQLIPPMSDQHLIRKLARHFGKEIEVAMITRGVTRVDQFENLLREFDTICEREQRNQYRNQQYSVNQNTGRLGNVDNGKARGGKYESERDGYTRPEWKNRHPIVKDEKGARQFNVNSLNIDGQQPSTSQAKNEKHVHTHNNPT